MDDPLSTLRRAAAKRRRAEDEYRAALLAAHRALVEGGSTSPYSTIARALGVARQTIRKSIERAS